MKEMNESKIKMQNTLRNTEYEVFVSSMAEHALLPAVFPFPFHLITFYH